MDVDCMSCRIDVSLHGPCVGKSVVLLHPSLLCPFPCLPLFSMHSPETMARNRRLLCVGLRTLQSGAGTQGKASRAHRRARLRRGLATWRATHAQARGHRDLNAEANAMQVRGCGRAGGWKGRVQEERGEKGTVRASHSTPPCLTNPFSMCPFLTNSFSLSPCLSGVCSVCGRRGCCVACCSRGRGSCCGADRGVKPPPSFTTDDRGRCYDGC